MLAGCCKLVGMSSIKEQAAEKRRQGHAEVDQADHINARAAAASENLNGAFV